MYLCVKGIYFVSFYDFSIELRNWSDSLIFSVFLFYNNISIECIFQLVSLET
jgi:hypothetical protein